MMFNKEEPSLVGKMELLGMNHGQAEAARLVDLMSLHAHACRGVGMLCEQRTLSEQLWLVSNSVYALAYFMARESRPDSALFATLLDRLNALPEKHLVGLFENLILIERLRVDIFPDVVLPPRVQEAVAVERRKQAARETRSAALAKRAA
jgi:hypothetical protein